MPSSSSVKNVTFALDQDVPAAAAAAKPRRRQGPPPRPPRRRPAKAPPSKMAAARRPANQGLRLPAEAVDNSDGMMEEEEEVLETTIVTDADQEGDIRDVEDDMNRKPAAKATNGASSSHGTEADDDAASPNTEFVIAGTTAAARSATRQQEQQEHSSNGINHNNHPNNSDPHTSSHGAAATTTPTMMCPNCGSYDIEQPHDASGASICTVCGVVVEENAIVSAVEFVEGAGGSSSMIGQFVSATSSKAYTGGAGGVGIGRGAGAGRYGFSRDSREATLAHGRRRIQEVASRLRLNTHFVDAAHRLFTVAVERNFVQGRRTSHVVAACLYIACRQEKSQHMLIDFSDALQTNVFTLGTCFLKFRRLLGLKLEIIDPALYVYRFAAHLNLNDKANAVAVTALRLVARMKRDWITAGRRPAGICAGALLIAARAHGFDRHHSDVTRILRVCGVTITSRVREFEQTPSAQLTLDQFATMDLESEADPPVFQRNRFREARARAIVEGDVALLQSGALDDPRGGKRASKWREPKSRRKAEKEDQMGQLYSSINQELQVALGETNEATTTSSGSTSTEGTDKETDGEAPAAASGTVAWPSEEVVLHRATPAAVVDLSKVPDKWRRVYPKSDGGKALILPNQATAEELQAPTAPVEMKIDLEEWKKGLPKEVDDEIESMLLTDEEERQKEVIFNKLNKDYLELQERKENDRKNAEAAAQRKEKELATQAEGHAKYKISRRKRGAPLTDDPNKSTEEHLMESIATRKISRKINYEALTSIFAEDGSFSTDAVDDGAAVDDPMFAEM